MAGWGGRRTLGSPQPPRVIGSRPQPGGPIRQRRAPSQPGVAPVYHPGDAPWQPPPIPAGAYNPIRDIELAAGKRGVGNTLEDIATRSARDESNLLLSEGDVHRQEDQQTQDRDRALAQIAQSFTRLGVRQGEQANTAGVLRGGALLQSAAKRAGNEVRAREPVQTNYARQIEADQRQLGQLVLQRQRDAEDLGTQGSRAEREQGQFGIDTETLKGREAAENGYYSPTGVVPRTTTQRGGFVRVGMPLRPQRRGRGL